MSKDQRLNSLFEAARNEAPKTSFDKSKTQFIKQTNVIASQQSWFKGLVNLKNGIIMLTISSLITAGILLFSSSDTETIIEKVKTEKKTINHTGDKIEPKLKPTDAQTKTPIYIDGLKQDLSSQPLSQASLPFKIEDKKSREFPKIEEGYQFPKLTEEDKEKVRKKKEEMVKDAQKRKGYSGEDNGRPFGTDVFISSTEVSNLEYRTFLFDLLMQGEKEAFLMAKPDQKNWGTFIYKDSVRQNPYVDLYFSHPAYNDYPVVNVSIIGAKMYCDWFQKLLNQDSDLSQQLFSRSAYEVCLPSIRQWQQATNWYESDSLPFDSSNAFSKVNYFSVNKHLSALNDHADITSQIKTYEPNKYGIYNLFGNVAEMVQTDSGYFAVGGSWNDSLDKLKLAHKVSLNDGFSGAKTIGFRPMLKVKTNWYCSNKEEIPQFTAKELEELEKRKKELVKELIKRKGYSEVTMNCSDCPYLSETELRNKDYKTFLFDLILSGKHDEYRKYAPNQEGWYMENEGAYMEPMVQQYFSHPAYDNYPLVNVSIEGIKAYIDWLNDLLDQVNDYWNHYKVSLPSKQIWETALKDGGNSLIPWTDDELALFYINYYNFHEIQVFGSNPERYLSKELLEKAKNSGLQDPLIYLHTGLVSIGYPNQEGFKNLLGNVSEVVEVNDNYMAIGGSWSDTLETIKKLEERVLPRSFEGSCVVGFRLALMKEGEQETSESGYRFPTITEEEIALVKEQKKLLIHLSDRKDELETRLAFGNYDTIRNADSVLMKVIPFKAKPLDLNASDSVGLRKYLYNLDYKSTGFLVDNQITNAQYRAFLFDLLIQGRRDDFLVAKPNQDNWKKLEEEPFLFLGFTSNAQDYFSHPHFNDYPVVNVPVKGMELFCEWYSELLNGASKLKDEFGVDKYYSVELPNNDQWIRTRRSNFNGMYPLKDSITRIIPVQTASKNNGFFDQENQGKYIHDIGEVILEEGQYHIKAYHWLSGFNAKIHIDSKIPFADQLEGSLLVGFRPIIRKVERPLVNHSDDIPELTAKDIKINNENKAELLKNYSKEKGLLFIPLGSMIHDDFNNGKALSVNSFFMAETETSIKDYYTFLFDLVIQGRTEDYLKAKPKIDYNTPRYSWGFYDAKRSGIEYYPVTGVSPEGVKLYCEWLTEEMNKNHPDKKFIGNETRWLFRLPSKEEWYYACSGGRLNYPMVFDSTYYRENALWQKDSTLSLGLGVRTVKDGDKNPFGLYHLDANAREMITSNDSVFFAGGSYGYGFMPVSYFHYDRLEKVKSDKDFKSDVGFRVVVPYLGGNSPNVIKATFK